MRTVANENENTNGSTNDPNPKLKGTGLETGQVSTIGKGQEQTPLSTSSTGSGLGPRGNKVSAKENRVDIPGLKPIKFTLSIEDPFPNINRL